MLSIILALAKPSSGVGRKNAPCDTLCDFSHENKSCAGSQLSMAYHSKVTVILLHEMIYL